MNRYSYIFTKLFLSLIMTDIEDIIQSEININILEFTKELASKHYSSRKEYDKEFVSLRRKYKMCPKKTDIRECIKDINPKDITEEFLKYSIRKLGKSSSSAYYSISDPAASKNSRCRRHIKAFLKAQQAVKESSKRNMSF